MNLTDNSVTRVLPPSLDIGDAPLLNVALDQGSVGASGMAFLESERGLLVITCYDKFHRVVRDVKLALQHAANSTVYVLPLVAEL